MGQALETVLQNVETLRQSPMAGDITMIGVEARLLDDAVREVRALQASRDRLFMEVQILQMTQGALKMEIDRLRAEAAPTIAATGAEMVFSRNGAIVIKADCLSITGDVVPA